MFNTKPTKWLLISILFLLLNVTLGTHSGGEEDVINAGETVQVENTQIRQESLDSRVQSPMGKSDSQKSVNSDSPKNNGNSSASSKKLIDNEVERVKEKDEEKNKASTHKNGRHSPAVPESVTTKAEDEPLSKSDSQIERELTEINSLPLPYGTPTPEKLKAALEAEIAKGAVSAERASNSSIHEGPHSPSGNSPEQEIPRRSLYHKRMNVDIGSIDTSRYPVIFPAPISPIKMEKSKSNLKDAKQSKKTADIGQESFKFKPVLKQGEHSKVEERTPIFKLSSMSKPNSGKSSPKNEAHHIETGALEHVSSVNSLLNLQNFVESKQANHLINDTGSNSSSSIGENSEAEAFHNDAIKELDKNEEANETEPVQKSPRVLPPNHPFGSPTLQIRRSLNLAQLERDEAARIEAERAAAQKNLVDLEGKAIEEESREKEDKMAQNLGENIQHIPRNEASSSHVQGNVLRQRHLMGGSTSEITRASDSEDEHASKTKWSARKPPLYPSKRKSQKAAREAKPSFLGQLWNRSMERMRAVSQQIGNKLNDFAKKPLDTLVGKPVRFMTGLLDSAVAHGQRTYLRHAHKTVTLGPPRTQSDPSSSGHGNEGGTDTDLSKNPVEERRQNI